MISTVVRVQKRAGARMAAFADGQTLCVPLPLFKASPLREGMTADIDEYAAYIEQNAYAHALQRACDRLSLRDHGENELYDVLVREGYGERASARVIAEMKRLKFLSDERFSRTLSTSRARRYGAMRVAQEMKQKGLSEDTVKQALADIPPEQWQEAADAQAEKALRARPERAEQVLQGLLRRGYSYQQAKSAVRRALSAREDDE